MDQRMTDSGMRGKQTVLENCGIETAQHTKVSGVLVVVGGTAIKLINVLICTKDPSSPARRRAWDDMFCLPVMNMKESGRTTSQMERARRRGRTAISTMVSVGWCKA